MSAPKPRRWFVSRYRLRTLLIVMTVVCVVSGYWLNRAFRQRDAVRRFNQLAADRGGDTPVTMLYHHKGDVHWAPIIPEWLHPVRDLVGSEAFGNPIGVQLVRTAATDDDLRYLKDVPKVEWVGLSQTKVTDKGLRHLRGCTKLNSLNLDNTAITDEGLAEIAGLAELQRLSLIGTPITDAGLEHLAKLTMLKYLSLRDTAITEAGKQKLQSALPQCEIHTDVRTGHP